MALNILQHTSELTKTDSNNGSYPGKPITEIIINGMFTVDRKWSVIYWNAAAEKLLGVKAENIVGKNIWEHFADTLPVNFYSSFHKAFLQDIPIHFEEYWAEKDAWFDVVTYYFENVLSVSFKSSRVPIDPEHPEAPVQQLKILTELYRFVTEITNDCLWEWNLQTNELFWIDGGHKRVFGYPVENALIPLPFWQSRLHPDDAGRVLKRLKSMIREGSGAIWEDEYRFKRIDGEYAYVHDRAHLIYDENHTATRMIGATQDISHRKMIELKLLAAEQQLAMAANENLKQITRAVLVAQERDRAIMGRELHDNLNQILGATKMYIEMAKTDKKNQAECLEKSSQYIVQVIEEIRHLSKSMVAPVKVMGLVGSIRMLLEDFRQDPKLSIEFHHAGVIEKLLDDIVQLNIFRIIQEQLSNIIKHAKASQVTLHLIQHADKIILLISDNGVGHDMMLKNEGVGIINIHSRAEGYGGKATITSQPGKGYEVKVELPLDRPMQISKPVKD
jgi:PAS domain S-box-containing protein